MADEQTNSGFDSIELATEVTVAWLSNPNVRATAEDVPAFLKSIHAALGELSSGTGAAPTAAIPEYVPAVPVRSSVKPDHLVSLIDGRKLKSLKRHLSSHGLTPKEYRERYGLKPDYPMVAPHYSAQRREVAQKLGLGRKPNGQAASASKAATTSSKVKPAPVAAPAPAAAPDSVAPKPGRRSKLSITVPGASSKPKVVKAKAVAAKADGKAPAAKRGRAKKSEAALPQS